ncbi:AAA-type ATPase family protein [Euphorbia peplus]|nr:AAA-type ATPase family protein [Euphorbia peplus]
MKIWIYKGARDVGSLAIDPKGHREHTYKYVEAVVLSMNYEVLDLEALSRLDGRRWSNCRSRDGLEIVTFDITVAMVVIKLSHWPPESEILSLVVMTMEPFLA